VTTGPANYFMWLAAWRQGSQSRSWNPAGSETLCSSPVPVSFASPFIWPSQSCL